MSQKSDIFKKAAEIIREEGWWQGSWSELDNDAQVLYLYAKGKTCKRCVSGALIEAQIRTGNEPTVLGGRPYYSVMDFLSVNFLHNEAVSSWNDNPNRTVDEVLELLEHAAEVTSDEQS